MPSVNIIIRTLWLLDCDTFFVTISDISLFTVLKLPVCRRITSTFSIQKNQISVVCVDVFCVKHCNSHSVHVIALTAAYSHNLCFYVDVLD
jgi:hypothetical protein